MVEPGPKRGVGFLPGCLIDLSNWLAEVGEEDVAALMALKAG